MAFDTTATRAALEAEANYFPDGGGLIELQVDPEDGSLGLTVQEDTKQEDTSTTVWLDNTGAAALHMWLTVTLVAAGRGEDQPELFDVADPAQGLVQGDELCAAYAPDAVDERPFTIEAIDTENGNGDRAVHLTLEETREWYPILTAVLLGTGALL